MTAARQGGGEWGLTGDDDRPAIGVNGANFAFAIRSLFLRVAPILDESNRSVPKCNQQRARRGPKANEGETFLGAYVITGPERQYLPPIPPSQ